MNTLVKCGIVLILSAGFLGFRPAYILNQDYFIKTWSLEDQSLYLEDPNWYSWWIYFNGDREDCIV